MEIRFIHQTLRSTFYFRYFTYFLILHATCAFFFLRIFYKRMKIRSVIHNSRRAVLRKRE